MLEWCIGMVIRLVEIGGKVLTFVLFKFGVLAAHKAIIILFLVSSPHLDQSLLPLPKIHYCVYLATGMAIMCSVATVRSSPHPYASLATLILT